MASRCNDMFPNCRRRNRSGEEGRVGRPVLGIGVYDAIRCKTRTHTVLEL
jgi:hypothetical protein